MKIFAVVLAVAALSATNAAAQFTITSAPQPTPAFGAEPTLRITSTFRTVVDLVPNATVPDAAAQESGRRTLYAMAANECASLSEIFKSECRLSSVQMVAAIVTPTAATAPNVMSATAVYELRPLRQTAGR